MQSESRNEDLAITLVEKALTRPEHEREAYLHHLCGSNSKLFAEAWSYILWENRMQGFLGDPVQPPVDCQPLFEEGQTLIGRFRLVREIARGGMGIVWEAFDTKVQERVALKCARVGFGKQLPPEVEIARRITHPNVCNIHDVHTASTAQGEFDFISMEFLEGETLADRIRRAPVPAPEACIIAKQICSGLAEAHRHQLIHGDLKTNNVILAKNPDGSVRAVIADFGLARRLATPDAATGGTPAYMAPELWTGAKPSVASDLYALGVMLWELHSGLPPNGLGVSSSTLPIGERVHWKPPTAPGKWNQVIARCLNPNPARRFKSAADVAVALGPSQLPKRVFAVASVLAIAAGSAFVSYERATAPAETVRLALVPFDSTSDNGSLSSTLFRNTADQLARLKGTPHTRFRFISSDKVIRNHVKTPEEARVLVEASHALRASVDRHSDSLRVHAYLTDLRSGVDARDWTAEFKPGELRYAPTALAALVTETLHLPPPTGGSTVNDNARQDYEAGLKAVKRDKTVDEALDRFGQAVKADPDSALTWAGLAEAQWFKFAVTSDKDWLGRMIVSVANAQLRNGDLPAVHSVAGLLKYREGQYEQAIAEYSRAIELKPKNGDAYRRLGDAFQRNEQLEEAQAAFREATRIDPLEYRNFRALGNFYFQRAAYPEAIAELQLAVQRAPDEAALHYRLAVAYQSTGQFSMAEKEARASLALSETATALHTLGVLLIYEKREHEAVGVIIRSLHLAPGTAVRWMNLGTAYRRTGQTANAAQAYRRGLEIAESDLGKNPRDASARSNLAYMCAQLRDERRAVSEITQALKQSPGDADVRWMAAITFEALRQRSETLSLLAGSPFGTLADLNRWPDVADLQKDFRFKELLAANRK